MRFFSWAGVTGEVGVSIGFTTKPVQRKGPHVFTYSAICDVPAENPDDCVGVAGRAPSSSTRTRSPFPCVVRHPMVESTVVVCEAVTT